MGPQAVNLTSFSRTANLYYVPTSDTIQTIVLLPSILAQNGNVTLLYNVTNYASNGSVVGQMLNQASRIVMTEMTIGAFDSTSLFKFYF